MPSRYCRLHHNKARQRIRVNAKYLHRHPFLDKKRSEGKKYYVYMTAGMTKFLRIYYGRVRDCLKARGLWEQPMLESGSSD